jgi:hypothetical protein
LRSPDGKEEARVLFKAGKGREGYFTNEDIMKQTERAMDILTNHYPNEDHILVFDNAPTHLKRADSALSARKMPKGISKPDHNFGVEVAVVGVDGKPVHSPDGSVLKRKIPMANGRFADGREQLFYFPEGHEHAGLFKGMAVILEERGFEGIKDKKASAAKSSRASLRRPTAAAGECCTTNLTSSQSSHSLKTACKARGFTVLFLPKFHCELNFIEQCWAAPSVNTVSFHHHQRRRTLRRILFLPWRRFL